MVKTKILVDEIADEPTNDFDKLSKTLAEIIKNSKPHFTIGVYGEWGTGKTTLMRAIEKKLNVDEPDLKKSKILPIWFNAWRYEREEQFATIAMMKTIAYGMAEHIKFGSVADIIKKGLVVFAKDIVSQLALQVITEEGVKDFEKNFTEKQKFLSNMEKDTIYFDGLNAISEQMKKIREKKGGNDYRIVVFIDDLDRCSPKKALEVLESIKVFLDIEGFVYVLGISHNTIDRLITYAYKEVEVEGSDYIKKIIQIPIKIPSWEKRDLMDLIENNLSKNLKSEYAELIIDNSDIITDAVDNNPRQLKRFINNLIIAYETFADGRNKISLNGLFITQIMKKKLPEFYKLYVMDEGFRRIVNHFLFIMKDVTVTKDLHPRIKWGLGRQKEKSSFIREAITEILMPKKKVKQEEGNAKNRIPIGMSIHDIIKKDSFKTSNPDVKFSNNYVTAMLSLSSKDWAIFRKHSLLLSKISNWETYDKAIDIVDIPTEKFAENG